MQPFSSLVIQQVLQWLSLPWTNSTATSTLPQRSHTILQSRLQWSLCTRKSIITIQWLTFHQHIESQWVTISSFPYIQYLLLFSVLHLGLKVKYITRYEDMSNIPVPAPSTTDPVQFFILFYNYLRTNYSLTGWQWWVCYILKYFSNQSHWILDKWGWRVSVQTSWEC